MQLDTPLIYGSDNPLFEHSKIHFLENQRKVQVIFKIPENAFTHTLVKNA